MFGEDDLEDSETEHDITEVESSEEEDFEMATTITKEKQNSQQQQGRQRQSQRSQGQKQPTQNSERPTPGSSPIPEQVHAPERRDEKKATQSFSTTYATAEEEFLASFTKSRKQKSSTNETSNDNTTMATFSETDPNHIPCDDNENGAAFSSQDARLSGDNARYGHTLETSDRDTGLDKVTGIEMCGNEESHGATMRKQYAPRYQTDFEAGNGNALQACVASILNLPLLSVPNFIKCGQFGYLEALNVFLEQYGLSFIKIPLKADGSLPFPAQDGCLCILVGYSPRHIKTKHCVVASISRGHRFHICHDPFPEATEPFLDTTQGPYQWAGFFVATHARMHTLYPGLHYPRTLKSGYADVQDCEEDNGRKELDETEKTAMLNNTIVLASVAAIAGLLLFSSFRK